MVEVGDLHSYMVRVHGSRHITKRNSQFLRKIYPFLTNQVSSMPDTHYFPGPPPEPMQHLQLPLQDGSQPPPQGQPNLPESLPEELSRSTPMDSASFNSSRTPTARLMPPARPTPPPPGTSHYDQLQDQSERARGGLPHPSSAHQHEPAPVLHRQHGMVQLGREGTISRIIVI